MAKAVEIPDAVRAAIYAEARAAFPAECCGYLIGRDGVAEQAIRCRNAQSDGDHPTHPERGADTGFVITGAELFAFARTFESDRPALVVYHSHTNGRAYLSTVDRDVAGAPPHYPVQHLVVGVSAVGLTEAAQFAWQGDAFVEVARWAIDNGS